MMMSVRCVLLLASLVPAAFSRTVATPCKGFKTDAYEYGKLSYSQPPIENATNAGRRALYADGTVARVECDRGCGTYRSLKYDDVEPNEAVEEERSATCVNGKWDTDLEISPWEDLYNNLVCEPENPDWRYSIRYGDGSGVWGSRKWGVRGCVTST
ncbi:hypothetical protein AAVH_13251 [Aphelenchoides avenae]|nr:hypothetical protein AAVH_13251 [Aphelenchus avenae]